METAKVKRYDVLYTTHIKKKQKTWKDGALRHHHYNSRMYLLAEDGAVLAESFYRPPAGRSKQGFPDTFVLDGEVEFEAGFLVEIGDVIWEGTTNLSDIKTATNEARSKAAEVAHAWAASEAASEASPRPSNASTSRARAVAAFYDSSSSDKDNRPVSKLAPIAVNGSTYRGFGIAPPQSYLGGKRPPSRNHPAAGKNTIPARAPNAHVSAPYSSAPKPYARPTSAARPSALDRMASLTADSPSSKPLPRPGPATTPMAGTPSRATASPFKAPRPRGTPMSVRKGGEAGTPSGLGR